MSDDEYVKLMWVELDFGKRCRVADVIYSRFVHLTNSADATAQPAFHQLVTKVVDLFKRRNDLLHSNYSVVRGVDGSVGLSRRNLELRPSSKEQREDNEDMFEGHLEEDLNSKRQTGQQPISDCPA